MKQSAKFYALVFTVILYLLSNPLLYSRVATEDSIRALILTPPSSEAPRINGPKVFGVRPNSPFLYTIPVTGLRPISYAVSGLPKGLQLDPTTGRMTGILKKTGEYKMTVIAQNARAKVERSFTIVVGDHLELTPTMGWNSWNCWGTSLTQDKTIRSARAMVALGLDRHGWTYINMDDSWQGKRDGSYSALQADAERYTDMKGMCDEIHNMGLKVGIYNTPWVKSYGGRLGCTSENAKGEVDTVFNRKAPYNARKLPYAIGKYSFVKEDARQMAEWGIDYLKYDWGPVEAAETKIMADAIKANGRDIILSLSNNHILNLFSDIKEVSALAQSWRTTTDINDSWTSMKDIGFSQDKWAPFAGPGHFNDPDMLVVGRVGWGKPHPTKLTPDEQYTHISLWCLLAAPLLIGCDMEHMDAFTVSLLSNDEVIDVDQDILGKQGVRIDNNGELDVYAKPLEDGSLAVGLFNRGPVKSNITAQWSKLGISGKQTVRDLWRQKDLGVFDNQFVAEVASHGVVFVRVHPSK
jgi:alpha-galactosidase